MTAAVIAQAPGIVYRSGNWWRCVCPVHGSRTGRGATLALRDADYGPVVVCHAGCDRDDILDELRHRGLISTPSRERAVPRPHHQSASMPTKDADKAERINRARWIWDAGLDPRGTPVAAYLAECRITLDPPPCLRWAPRLRRPDKTYGPGMIALVPHIKRGVVGIYRTWLERDVAGNWRRLDRASLGPIGGFCSASRCSWIRACYRAHWLWLPIRRRGCGFIGTSSLKQIVTFVGASHAY